MSNETKLTSVNTYSVDTDRYIVMNLYVYDTSYDYKLQISYGGTNIFSNPISIGSFMVSKGKCIVSVDMGASTSVNSKRWRIMNAVQTTSRNIVYTLYSYKNNTLIGSKTCNGKVKFSNSPPANVGISQTPQEGNSTVYALGIGANKFLQGQSTIEFTCDTATPQGYAQEITDYSISFGGITETSNTTSIDFVKPNVYGENIKLELKVTDNRGEYSTESDILNTITILPYSPPYIQTNQYHNFVLKRVASNPTSVILGFYAPYEPITVISGGASTDKNAIQSVVLKYKKIGDVSYSSEDIMSHCTISDGSVICNEFSLSAEFDENYAYDVRIVITDKLGSWTNSFTINKFIPLVSFRQITSGSTTEDVVGINKADPQCTLDVNGYINASKGVVMETPTFISIRNPNDIVSENGWTYYIPALKMYKVQIKVTLSSNLNVGANDMFIISKGDTSAPDGSDTDASAILNCFSNATSDKVIGCHIVYINGYYQMYVTNTEQIPSGSNIYITGEWFA